MSSSRRPRWPSLSKSALGAAVALGALGAGQAHADCPQAALTVNVGGQNYNLSLFCGSYNDNAAKFATPSNGGVMPWWGNQSMAFEFAMTINNGLGHGSNFNPSGNPQFGGTGPYFAIGPYSLDPTDRLTAAFYDNFFGPIYSDEVSDRFGGGAYGIIDFATDPFYGPIPINANRVWAQSETEVGAPGPLPALGAAAAFGFSRKLRKRIKSSKATSTAVTAV